MKISAQMRGVRRRAVDLICVEPDADRCDHWGRKSGQRFAHIMRQGRLAGDGRTISIRPVTRDDFRI